MTEQQGWIEPLMADLKIADGLTTVTRRIVELGSVDLLINNAGIATGGDFLAAPWNPRRGELLVAFGPVTTLARPVKTSKTKRIKTLHFRRRLDREV